MAGDKTYITDGQGKQHRATRVHAVTPTNIVWSSNPNDYAVQVLIDGKWHRAILTYDVSGASYFDNVNIDKALVVGSDGKNHTALIVSSEAAVTLSSIKTDEHALVDGTTTGETAVCTYTEAWGNIEWEDNVNVYKVIVTGSDGKKHTALLTTGASGGVQAIVLGVAPLSLPGAAADDILSLIAFGGTQQEGVPQEYTRLDRLQGDGNAYIDLGITLNQDNEIEVDFIFKYAAGSQIFGYRDSASSKNITLFSGGGAGSLFMDFNNSDYTNYRLGTTGTDDAQYTAKISKAKRALYSGTTEIVANNTACPDTFTTGNALLFFAGGNPSGTAKFTGSILGVRIKDRMNLVPAKRNSDSVLGMYDMITGQFFTNAAGSGAFIAGDPMTPTPAYPADILCNNGVLKFTANEANYIADNVTLGYWIRNNNGQPESSPANFYTAMMPVKPDVSYVCFGRNKETDVISGYNRIAWYDADGVWIRNSTYTQNQPGIDVAPSNAAFARFHCNINDTDVTQELVDSYNWVFQQGTAEVPYTPYSPTGIYTDGTQETIAIIGPNLFDKTNYEEINAYVNANTGVLTQGSPGPTTQYCAVIPCKPNTTYKITGRGTSAWGTFTAKTIGTTATTYDKETGIITTGASDLYLIGLVRANNDAIDYRNTLSVNEVVSTATTEMLLSVGDYTDEQEVISGAVTRKVGIRVLDGTETWAQTTTNVVEAAIMTGQQYGETAICSHLVYSSAGSFGAMADNSFKTGTATYKTKIYCKSSIYATDTTTWQNWLAAQYAAGRPVIVIYPLATPTTESVTGQPMQTAAGDNTAEITQAGMAGLELEVTYMKGA